MRVSAIIQARMGSTRLPGKVLKKILDQPLLSYEIERLRNSQLLDEIIVATTVSSDDDPIVDFCQEVGVLCFRGSEEDVLSRYFEAALQYSCEVIVRLTADCPLIDPQIVDQVIKCYLKSDPRVDYVSNVLQRTYPRGMDTEVFSFASLEMAHNMAVAQEEREHVTLFMYRNPQLCTLKGVENEVDWSKYRLTVDEKDDFLLIKEILETLYPGNPLFSVKDIVGLLEGDQALGRLNAHVQQKKIGGNRR